MNQNILNILRGLVIVFSGAAGGYLVDDINQNKHPVATVTLPIMSVFIAIQINTQNEGGPEEES